MGQTKKDEEAEIVYVKTRLKSSTYPMIVLPQKILEHIYIETGTKIMKLHIENDIETDYIWEYNPNRKPYIVFKELKHGEYKITIKPYTLKDFLREYNTKMREKGITLTIEDGNLIVTVKNQGKIKTKEWKFEKEHGGAVHIIAKYISPISGEEKALIKFQLKGGKAKMYILEKQGPRKRLSPRKVTYIRIVDNYVEIDYKHGRKTKKKGFFTGKAILHHGKEYSSKIRNIKIDTVKISGYRFTRYEYRVIDEDFAAEINNKIRKSYLYLKMGDESTSNQLKEEVGISIALQLLKQYKYGDALIHPENTRYKNHLKRYFGNLKPDVLLFKGNAMLIVEIKYRTSERKAREIAFKAINQVTDYMKGLIRRMYRKPPYIMFGHTVSKVRAAVIIVGYSQKLRGGYIYYWTGEDWIL